MLSGDGMNNGMVDNMNNEIAMEDVVNYLKKHVRWEMSNVQTKARNEEESAAGPPRDKYHADYRERIRNLPDIEPQFEDSYALAILLLTETVFINNHWWMDKWPDDAKKKFSLNVNTNDVLAWGCADAEGMNYEDLEDVYTYWEKDPVYGTAVWYCKRVGMMPQRPVAAAIRKGGIWDIDSMGLEKNSTDRT